MSILEFLWSEVESTVALSLQRALVFFSFRSRPLLPNYNCCRLHCPILFFLPKITLIPYDTWVNSHTHPEAFCKHIPQKLLTHVVFLCIQHIANAHLPCAAPISHAGSVLQATQSGPLSQDHLVPSCALAVYSVNGRCLINKGREDQRSLLTKKPQNYFFVFYWKLLKMEI